ncbi:DUF3231 family protein [Paenibacillus sp. YYML68]|uniref:DUF3231 family protein n=1 Tax=Paenibacillus sp. YYML68 TaxID=2909250 RepID=UPI0024931C0B|nr:DUF3231 family protein [Paenibacillus sp. YYML68]
MANVSVEAMTSAEMGKLWATYLFNNYSGYVLTVFEHHAADEQIKQLLQRARQLGESNQQAVKQMMQEHQFPIPEGFSQQDIDLSAPPLYTDPFYLYYYTKMASAGLEFYVSTMPLMTQPSIRKLFNGFMTDTIALLNELVDLKMSKGLYVKPPYIPIPERVTYAKSANYLSGFLKEKRSLHALGITSIFNDIQFSYVMHAYLLGFSQVAKNEEIRRYVTRCSSLLSELTMELRTLLEDESIGAGLPTEANVTASTRAPFSDKLMLFMSNQVMSVLIRLLGRSFSETSRHDLSVLYMKQLAKVSTLAQDGMKLLLDQGWFEEPPQSPNRQQLIRQH